MPPKTQTNNIHAILEHSENSSHLTNTNSSVAPVQKNRSKDDMRPVTIGDTPSEKGDARKQSSQVVRLSNIYRHVGAKNTGRS